MTRGKRNQKQAGFVVKTFPVPFALIEKQEHISISTNTPYKPSKEQVINQAFNFHSQGNIQEATKYYKKIINQGCNDHRVFSNYGAMLKGIGKLKEAELYTRKAIDIKPDLADLYYNLGIILKDLGDLKEAEVSTRKAIELNHNFTNAYANLGEILSKLGNLEEAETSTRKAIDLNPNYAEAHSNLGMILRALGNLEEAETSTRKAIDLNPNYAEAHSNLGMILKALGNLKEAELSLSRAIKINPDLTDAYSNLGNILRDLGNLQEAELSYRKAIQLSPNSAEAHSNLGTILSKFGKSQEAELSIRKAIELKPSLAEAHLNLGGILNELGNLNEAINHYKKAIKFNNSLSIAKAGLIKTKGRICDWSNQDIQTNWLKNLGIEGSCVLPFSLLPYQDNPLKHLKRAQNLYQQNHYQPEYSIPLSNNEKIHIGYFSADFKDHPVMLLLASILELHDKEKYKISLYSFVEKEDEYTERARKSGCIFKDISKLNHIEAVELARDEKIDIAIDLMGYTRHNRFSIFSSRIAPIQINYLGYPGSIGTNKLDYIIADKIVIPDGHERFYNEKIIRMPNCYLCTDDKMEISKDCISRKDCNLPDKGFIFTCFNSLKKITPNEFDIWMRLLKKTNDSVLWLKGQNKMAINNLCLEAEKRNIDKNRLIFANNLPLDKHLARHSLASLGLDTFAFNGCSTSTFGLWAGMPILTKQGKSYAARFTSSLLNTMGLSELITYSESEYEEKALYLAQNPEKLISLKSKLDSAKETSPMFNSELFTRDLETKYVELVKSHSF